ncbi:MAG TPA: YhjD/YihY/BrkB family envelope integrity protein [Methylotenera sp.]|nr:YhjD/YihY/BrkB family envelope integrity protein [Methylotenera sp.]HPV44343.1 YhjD/YihY/BrkB family envelope integrity protein [Methylotenera sp.]
MNAYARQEYATPLFVLRETLAAFVRHNIFGISASLSFYALFALIPLVLLIFFILSHLVFSSDYTIVKLAILMGNLVPEFSSKIMVEVYSATQTKAAWGVLGLLVLLWTITPLASAMRSAFYTIASKVEAPSFFKRKFENVISVLGILLLFFLFTSAGFVIESSIRFLAAHLAASQLNLIGTLGTLLLTTLLIAIFYKVFFPLRIAFVHLLLGAFLTALLWLIMRPAFGLFLSLNPNYGAMFGGMKTMFVSITWLYLNFAVFLLGTELISTLRKKDVLLLKGLFDDTPNKANYIEALMSRYGVVLRRGEYVFERGNTERNLYYLVGGTVHLTSGDKILRELNSNDYFGEMAILTKNPTTADAVVASDEARIIVIYAENIDTLLADEPKVAMRLLKHMASRLQNSYS